MTHARKQRLKEARLWYPERHFTEESHIVKAYRKRFGVDRDCAMRDLCLLGVLSATKQKTYKQQLAMKDRKRKLKSNNGEDVNPYQNETFAFIAGYTSGGVPYGVTWDELGEQ